MSWFSDITGGIKDGVGSIVKPIKEDIVSPIIKPIKEDIVNPVLDPVKDVVSGIGKGAGSVLNYAGKFGGQLGDNVLAVQDKLLGFLDGNTMIILAVGIGAIILLK